VSDIPYIPGGTPGNPQPAPAYRGKALPDPFGPRPGWLRRPEIRRQILTLAYRLEERVTQFGLSRSADHEAGAHVLCRMIFSDDEETRHAAVNTVCASLLDVGERESPDFWATDLGRAIAREIGYVTPFPTRAIAESVLHVSRQGVFQMLKRGDLESVGGNPSRESLRVAAAKRWPMAADVDDARPLPAWGETA